MMTLNKILLVQLGRIGDLILMTPAINALHQKFPDAKIDLLLGKHNALLAPALNHINKVYVHQKSPWPILKLLRQLRAQKYDLWLDPKDHPSTESQWFARLSKAKKIIAFSEIPAAHIWHPVARDRDQADLHAVSRVLRTLLPLGIQSAPVQPALQLQPQSEQAIEAFSAVHKIKRMAIINISASVQERYWTMPAWQQLLKHLISKELQPAIIAAPDDRKLAQDLANAVDGALYYPTASIFDAISAVAAAKLVITVDTAVIHMAAAFNVPTIGLYADYKPNYIKFRPLSQPSTILVPEKASGLIADISVGQACSAVDKILLQIQESVNA